jgi:predicted Mrr-cat superfamily restriction endonuclease
VANGSRDDLARHIREVCTFYKTDRARGSGTGQLYRFGKECSLGDYVIYYDPPHKWVVLCRVTSEPKYRDFDAQIDEDIWHYRKVERVGNPIPILDFYAPLKGALLGPRMSFWEVGHFEDLDLIAQGKDPHIAAAPDPEFQKAYEQLSALVLKRMEALNDKDWELLAVDFFRAQGAHVDDSKIGGSRAIIDAEAKFNRGELGEDLWRIQVKRYQNQQVDWTTIESDFKHVGDTNFCFVSVYGFTEDARSKALEEGVWLLERGDFVRFLLGGRIRPELHRKLKLPVLTTSV